MKDLRVPQLRMVEHLRCDDIHNGLATVKASKFQGSEGWTLPGCKFTQNRELTKSEIVRTILKNAINVYH